MGGDDGGKGAWGFRLSGVPQAERVLIDAPSEWSSLRVTIDHDVADLPDDAMWTAQEARFGLLGGGYVRMSREPTVVRLSLPGWPADECVVQPHLASAAATASLWEGRQALHAGAFVLDGGAWVVLGDKEDGKSSTLGCLHVRGVPVLTDDLTVWSEGEILAGPRAVDLRPEAAQRLGIGRDLGVVGTRARWRVDLGGVGGVGGVGVSAPLGGFVFLAWGLATTVQALSPTQRFAELTTHRALRLPWLAADALLEMASRPAYRWTRRQSWDDIDGAIDHLLDALSPT